VTVEVTLLTQDACAFCDDAKRILDDLAGEHDISVLEVDLSSAEGQRLARASGVLFPPGILFDGDPVAYGRPSARHLRRELQRRASSHA
jgi:glutaredoxin